MFGPSHARQYFRYHSVVLRGFICSVTIFARMSHAVTSNISHILIVVAINFHKLKCDIVITFSITTRTVLMFELRKEHVYDYEHAFAYEIVYAYEHAFVYEIVYA